MLETFQPGSTRVCSWGGALIYRNYTKGNNLIQDQQQIHLLPSPPAYTQRQQTQLWL